MTNSTYMLTISAFKKNSIITILELSSAFWTIKQILELLGNQLEVVNHYYENSGKYNQLHTHSIIRVAGFFRYNKHTKVGPFKLDWKYLKTTTDIHYAQIYVSKDQYEHDKSLE